MSQFASIGLITKPDASQVVDTLCTVHQHLLEQGIQVYLEERNAELVKNAQSLSREQMGQRCDLAIVIGGDGTLLGAARSLAEYDIPIVGINLGNLGFLVDVPASDHLSHLDQILAGAYIEESRFLLQACVKRGEETFCQGLAMNDVVIHIKNVVRMVEFKTYINGQFVNRQRADGLIVSTPSGSTAYALSGGGPILHPSLECITLLPICPHTLSSRPIVVAADSLVEICISEMRFESTHVVYDGQEGCDLQPDDRIVIQKSPHPVRLLHPKDYDYYHILREKLNWG
ncbi:MAG: NAD(+) kinase [Gammaproteobacteria bacterium]|nr:NAD(+) kinase [Gammaproteobacteria bacterium]